MIAPTTSHAALIAEVTALRATLNDAVELCETLRSERDALRAASDDALEAIVCLAQRRVLSASKNLYGCDCFRCRAADKLRAALGRSAPL